VYAESGLQESTRRFTQPALCPVFGLGFRVSAGLGLIVLCVILSVVSCRPHVLWFSSIRVAQAGDAWVGVAFSSYWLVFELYSRLCHGYGVHDDFESLVFEYGE
jgi:hypothetical protein